MCWEGERKKEEEDKKRGWEDVIESDIRLAGVCEKDAGDCILWNTRTRVVNPK